MIGAFRGWPVRSATSYLKQADAFADMANAASHPQLRRRLADLAECYRILARERNRLAAGGTIPSEAPVRNDD